MTIIISKKKPDAEFLWVLHEVWILNIKESQASIMHHQAHFQLDPHSSPEFGTARSLVSIHLSLKIHTPRNFKTIGSGTCPSRNITAPSWEGNTFPIIDPVSTFLHLLALAPCGSRICWRSQDLRAVLLFGTWKKPWKKHCYMRKLWINGMGSKHSQIHWLICDFSHWIKDWPLRVNHIDIYVYVRVISLV